MQSAIGVFPATGLKVEMLFAHLKRILVLDRLRLRGPSGAHARPARSGNHHVGRRAVVNAAGFPHIRIRHNAPLGKRALIANGDAQFEYAHVVNRGRMAHAPNEHRAKMYTGMRTGLVLPYGPKKGP
jgi:hypothetical protein